jgi:hypothetical protein
MAINRLLYSQQTCIIQTGGAIIDQGLLATPPVANNVFKYVPNTLQSVKDAKSLGLYGTGTPAAKNPSGFAFRNWLLPVQSASVDETIPQEDVLVLGKLGGAARQQKDVATSKCTIKAYLADYMKWMDDDTLRDAGAIEWLTRNNDGATPPVWDTDYSHDGSWPNVDYKNATEDNTAANLDSAGGDPGGTIEETQLGKFGQTYEQNKAGPVPGITHQGYLAGEAWVQNGVGDWGRQGMLEQLIWEAMGGYEANVALFHPSFDGATYSRKDGFTFLGILSSISIDASKGAYPTMDLNFEGVGAVQAMAMSAHDFDSDGAGADAAVLISTYGSMSNAGDWYVDSCNPHTSEDVAIWGRDQEFNTTTGATIGDSMTLIAGNARNYYLTDDIIAGDANGVPQYGQPVSSWSSDPYWPQSRVGDAIANTDAHDAAGGKQGTIDTINSAKMSFDMPTETLSALGSVIEGRTLEVRRGNATFSKPPYKASLNLDGQGLRMAGTDVIVLNANNDYVTEERILPNEIQIGQLHCVIEKEGAAVSSRSMNQNVGDVGASYTVAVEGTMASFRANYQDQKRNIVV